MKNNLLIILTAIGIVLVLVFSVWWQFYKFHDCRRVGHTKTYCIIKIGD